MKKLNTNQCMNINGGLNKKQKNCLKSLGFSVGNGIITGATSSAIATLGVGTLGGAIIGLNAGLVAGAVGCAKG
ncbi:hypothetical protein [Staphylococcus hyicus]|uniref:hypothetical protein n=1 Tax=Staphylococcus hyicus TaxID=1284 RepID=UPI003132EA1F